MPDMLIAFLVAFAAAALSGVAGFGGALLLLPLLVAQVGVEQAVPLLTVAQFIGNLSRAGFGFRAIRWQPVGMFLLAALPASVAGARFFAELPQDWATRSVGAVILLFVALRISGRLRFHPGRSVLLLGGALTGFVSGLAGSAGPLGAAVFLSLGLPPLAYVASEAVTALAIHGAKMAVYQQTLDLAPAFWPLAAVLGVAMVLGTWAAKGWVARLSVQGFQRVVGAMLVAVALYMLIAGA